MLGPMRGRFAGPFRAFTIAACAVSAWTVYANVLSDDSVVRERARQVARNHLGGGDKPAFTGMRGSRGMIEERVEYDVSGRGLLVVVCRRQYLVFGDYACEVGKP